MHYKFFIASSSELKAERDECVLVITELNKLYPQLRFEPVLFELDMPSGSSTLERIQDDINILLEEADIMIVLFYSRIGQFTKEEFNLAGKKGKKIFLYFKDGFTPTTTEEIKSYTDVMDLRKLIDQESHIRYLTFTREIFNGLLYKDLSKYVRFSLLNSDHDIQQGSLLKFPKAPAPFLAHPYGVAKNFTGRMAEQEVLTAWAGAENNPVCVITAIGGTGKSTLCWKWLHNTILNTPGKYKGIIWWSFYQQGFEEFLNAFYHYTATREIKPGNVLRDEIGEILQLLINNRFLLIWDGFERLLRGYTSSEEIAASGSAKEKTGNEHWEKHKREPVSQVVDFFLKSLTTGKSKILINSRHNPTSLEGLEGVEPIDISGLSLTDTVEFFNKEGITATSAEISKIGTVYDFHPLMLKLFCSAMRLSRTRLVTTEFLASLINEKEPRKILDTSFSLLNTIEKEIAKGISIFRNSVEWEAVYAIFPGTDQVLIDKAVFELISLGFVLYNETEQLITIHPVIRVFLYEQLKTDNKGKLLFIGKSKRQKYHERAIKFLGGSHLTRADIKGEMFAVENKVFYLSEIQHYIDIYYHLIQLNRFYKAALFYRFRLTEYLHYQFSYHHLVIELLENLLSTDKKDKVRIRIGHIASYILNDLAISHSNIGDFQRAMELHFASFQIERKNKREGMAIGFENISTGVLIPQNKLIATQLYLNKSNTLLEHTADKFHVVVNYLRLSKTAALRGHFSTTEINSAEFFLGIAAEIMNRVNQKWLFLESSFEYYAGSLILSKIDNDPDRNKNLLGEALDWALANLEKADVYRVNRFPQYIRLIKCYQLIAKCLIAFKKLNRSFLDISNKVFFYDESLQHITDKITITKKNVVTVIERCVTFSLLLSKKSYDVEEICSSGLLDAEVFWITGGDKTPDQQSLKKLEDKLMEVLVNGTKYNLHIVLADLHLFCATMLIELLEKNSTAVKSIIGFTAAEHIQAVKIHSADQSQPEDLFIPAGKADFYHTIPGYELFTKKRTEQEKLENGYYTAWQKAQILEKRLAELS